jgi:hypothetical protein
MQQEYLAEPRLLALSGADAVLVNCRNVLEDARRIGLPAAFLRMVGKTLFFNRAMPITRRFEDLEPRRSEMIFERGGSSCYSFEGHVGGRALSRSFDDIWCLC